MGVCAIQHLRSLLRLAESAQKAGDDELVGVALAAAEVLAHDNPPIDVAPVSGWQATARRLYDSP